MVNLLFISNNPKMEALKKYLQPLLKVKIDIVSDFDYGLKDVFEKRPATVFIQDHIAGVTGESVARHIQMLLGSGSPAFIFMHAGGGGKAKPINGLFEHLIDLSQLEVKIVEDILAALKSLLGPQWDKIVIPPKMDRAAIRSAVAVPEGSRAFADQLVDDFISNLDNFGPASLEDTGKVAVSAETVTPADEQSLVILSSHDQFEEILSESISEPNNTETKNVVTCNDTKKETSVASPVKSSAQQNTQTVFSDSPEVVASAVTLIDEQSHSAPKTVASADQLISTTSDVAIPHAPRPVPENPQQQVSPADFIIGREEKPAEDVAPEDLLRVFEGSCYSHSGGWGRYVTIAVVIMVCAGGSFWYLLNQKPQLLAYLSRPFTKSVVVSPATQAVEPAISVQKPVSASAQKAVVSLLPSFIKPAGLDRSYASLNPGWERYVNTTLEFRLYRADGKFKALQVLGINKHAISESNLKSILNELVGNGEYRVESSEHKLGYNVLRAIGAQKSELLIYRQKNTIRAFVVSLN